MSETAKAVLVKLEDINPLAFKDKRNEALAILTAALDAVRAATYQQIAEDFSSVVKDEGGKLHPLTISMLTQFANAFYQQAAALLKLSKLKGDNHVGL